MQPAQGETARHLTALMTDSRTLQALAAKDENSCYLHLIEIKLGSTTETHKYYLKIYYHWRN